MGSILRWLARKTPRDGTRFFTAKARQVSGLDPSARALDVARRRYRDFRFEESHLEETPFEPESFDAVICCETLEHVENEVACLSELHRILKPGGVAVITTPHRGLLGFMDPDNYGASLLRWAKHHFPGLYRLYRRRLASRRGSSCEPQHLEGSATARHVHRHYTLKDLRLLLDQSAFRGRYEVVQVLRSGLVIEMLVVNVHFFLSRVLRGRLMEVAERVFGRLIALDYRVPYGALSNDLAIQIVKRG